jgi:hypothetical protein
MIVNRRTYAGKVRGLPRKPSAQVRSVLDWLDRKGETSTGADDAESDSDTKNNPPTK